MADVTINDLTLKPTPVNDDQIELDDGLGGSFKTTKQLFLAALQAQVDNNTAKVSADGSVTTHSDVTSAGSGQIITGPERTLVQNSLQPTSSVTALSDVTDAGSGQIITAAERSAIATNTAANSGTVTIHSDITSAGSGAIITVGERANLASALQPGANISELANDAGYITQLSDDTSPTLGGNLSTAQNGFEAVAEASEAIAVGEVVTAGDGPFTAKLASAASTATALGALGIALESAAVTENFRILWLGIATLAGPLTPGAVYYLSVTPGAITATAPSAPGQIVRVLGVAYSTTQMQIVPDNTWVEIA